MPSCAIYACGNYNIITKGTNIKYYRFPKDENILKQWINACKRQDTINLKHACVCSAHFEPSCFEMSPQQRFLNYLPKNFRNLRCDAVPTLNLAGQKKESDLPGKRNKTHTQESKVYRKRKEAHMQESNLAKRKKEENDTTE